MDNRRIRKTYDRDFKVSAMKLILEKHLSVTKVSRDLGVSQNRLHGWKKAFLEDSRSCFPGNGIVTEDETEEVEESNEVEVYRSS